MTWSIAFEPLIPLAWLALLGLAGTVLWAGLLYTRTHGAWLRGLALALLLATLGGPALKQEDRQPISDIAVVVMDRTSSQSTGNRTAQSEQALEAVKAAVKGLGNTDLRVVESRSGIESGSDGTRLMASLGEALAEVPPERFAGAILITDGQVHDVPQDPATSTPGAPVHALLSGSRSETDRRVIISQAPRFGIVGKEQVIRFRVEDQGSAAGTVSVTIRQDGGEPETREVATGNETEITVSLTHGGQNIVEIAAAPLDGEIAAQNNRAVATIEGIRDRLRVLLVSGEPHAGERTWRNLLKADAAVDLVHFTILRPPEKQDGTPTKELSLIAFPTRELFADKIDEFDLVIFDRYRMQEVLPEVYLSNVADYVRRGGAVLLASGPDFAGDDGLYSTSLADVLAAAPTGDVTETPYRPLVTPMGKRHPVTRDLPGDSRGDAPPSWGRWFRLVNAVVTGDAEVVMSGPADRPLLVLSRRGEGRVAQLLSDHGWLWTRGYEGGGPQSELLRRLAHWLMKEPDLEEEALTAQQDNAFITVERRTMKDKAEPAIITLPSGKTETVTLTETSPGRFTGRIAASEAGTHMVSDGTFTAAAAIGNADAREAGDIRATDKILAPLAAATGGGVHWLEQGQPRLLKVPAGRTMSGSGWMALRDNGLYSVTSVSSFPLFSTLLGLAALLLAVSAMWYREGR
jgi:hypothetical protein